MSELIIMSAGTGVAFAAFKLFQYLRSRESRSVGMICDVLAAAIAAGEHMKYNIKKQAIPAGKGNPKRESGVNEAQANQVAKQAAMQHIMETIADGKEIEVEVPAPNDNDPQAKIKEKRMQYVLKGAKSLAKKLGVFGPMLNGENMDRLVELTLHGGGVSDNIVRGFMGAIKKK